MFLGHLVPVELVHQPCVGHPLHQSPLVVVSEGRGNTSVRGLVLNNDGDDSNSNNRTIAIIRNDDDSNNNNYNSNDTNDDITKASFEIFFFTLS